MNEERLIQKNLVFEGGGVLLMLYLGAAFSLEKYGLLAKIRRVAGASAGSIMSTLVSLKLTAQEIKDNVDKLDFSKILQKRDQNDKKEWLLEKEFQNLIGGNAQSLERLFTKYGYYSSSYFYNWLLDTIGQYTGKKESTFADFREQGFHDLHVVVTNMSQQKSQTFSADTNPDVAVADAVRMSMSIPLFFESLQFDGTQFGCGDYHSDGGVMNNYPISTFDQPKFSEHNPFYISGINWETLGFRHYTPPEYTSIKPITDFLSFVDHYIAATLKAQEVPFETSVVNQKRSVNMSDCGVPQTNFTIKPGDEQYTKLFEMGKQATEKYLQAYEPPASASR